MATIKINIGPCDDDGFVYVNGNEVVQVHEGEVSEALLENLADGDYEITTKLGNGGGGVWRFVASVLINGKLFIKWDNAGGFPGMLYTGWIPAAQHRVTAHIRNGVVTYL